MTKVEAKGLGLENASNYFKCFNGKLNFAPPSDKVDWYQLVNISKLKNYP